MSDLIKRSDAIKALYKYSFASKDVIEKEIRAIPAADRPQGWIPCSERLPEDEGRYLCTVNAELHQVRDMLYKPTSWGGEHRCKWKLQEDCYAYDWFVLAWMPLPKPWRGADDE